MARDVTDSTPISSRDELVGWLEEGCKGDSALKLGTEHEKFPFYTDDLSPVPYEGRGGRGGIGAILQGVRDTTGWEPIEDDGSLIGLFDERAGGAVSLEPGGQFELSGAPLDNVHETESELDGAHRTRQQGRGAARHSVRGPWHEPAVEPGGNAAHAQEPLSHHDELHAEGRHARARHDVPHLHRAGERRLSLGSRHGAQAARLDRAATDRHRAVRQFALHRRQAERIALGAL